MRLNYLLDRINYYNDDSIEATKNLALAEEIFSEHFPHKPIYPAAFMVQAVRDLCFWHIELVNRFKYSYRLTAVDKVTFKGYSVPGDQVIYQAKLVKPIKDDIYHYVCKAFMSDADIMSAKLSFQKHNIIQKSELLKLNHELDLLMSGEVKNEH
jgi:3-hydroxyacyl-[acyl-carrier-protein] dehydratase